MKRVFIISLILISLLFVPKEPEVKNVELATAPVQVNEQVTSRSLSEPRADATDIDVATIEPQIVIATDISQEGIDLIKKYEGLRLKAYKLKGEEHFTIGYGHYGSDVKEGQTITEEQAERLLIADLQGTVEHILNNYSYLELNQAELNAITSFTYNCGIGSLNKLTANKTRTKEEIAEHITAYTKSESEVNRNGLQKRRNEEKEMFQGIY